MLPERRLHVVSDIEDTPEQHRLLRGLAERSAGAIRLIEPTPSGSNLQWLAQDVLRGAFAKQPSYNESVRNANENWQRVLVWTCSEAPEHLIVNRAYQLTATSWRRLIELACVCDCQVWFVVQGTKLRRHLIDAVGRWDMETMSFEQFRERWGPLEEQAPRRVPDGSDEGAPQSGQVEGGLVLAEIPCDDFVTFRDSCHALLTKEQFAVVDSVFRQQRDATRAWLESRALDIDESGIHGHLMELATESATLPELTVRVRAAQAVLALEDWLMTVKGGDLLAISQAAQRTLALTEEVVEPLKAYSTPFRSAIPVVVLAAEASPEEIIELRLGDIGDGETNLTIGRGSCQRRVEVPSHSQSCVRAQVTQRLLEGAGSDDPLFSAAWKADGRESTDGQKVSARSVRTTLRRAAVETGLPLTTHHVTTKAPDPVKQLRSWGVRLCPISQRWDNRLPENRGIGRRGDV